MCVPAEDNSQHSSQYWQAVQQYSWQPQSPDPVRFLVDAPAQCLLPLFCAISCCCLQGMEDQQQLAMAGAWCSAMPEPRPQSWQLPQPPNPIEHHGSVHPGGHLAPGAASLLGLHHQQSAMVEQVHGSGRQQAPASVLS
jgi:hypothetical protein